MPRVPIEKKGAPKIGRTPRSNGDGDRWLLPDRRSALKWCRARNVLGIKTVLDVLGKYSHNTAQAAGSARAYISSARAIEEQGLNASFAIKLSTLGAGFDRELCRRKLLSICAAAAPAKIGIEIDMEAKSLVDFYVGSALEAADKGYPVSLALQVYLDRTAEDMENLISRDVRIRLVKGAYLGDTMDFAEIQQRLEGLALRLANSGLPFCIGTHDPEIISWAKAKLFRAKGSLEFGFLKGLSDETKVSLASEGWRVAEYVPFGKEGGAYVLRRLQYLRRLKDLGRTPAP
ncbi:MAG: proline dehydrogenase family protein [Deltaproteobacteria bacterium]